MVILTKYTIEIKDLLAEGIAKAKREEKLPITFNKFKIPFGKFIFFLITFYLFINFFIR